MNFKPKFLQRIQMLHCIGNNSINELGHYFLYDEDKYLTDQPFRSFNKPQTHDKQKKMQLV